MADVILLEGPVLLYDANGLPMAVQHGVAIPAGTSGLMAAGRTAAGNAAFLPISAAGNLQIAIAEGGGAGGTALADKGVFTEGTTVATPVSGVYNETLGTDAVEDRAIALRSTIKRALHTNLRTATGVEAGTALSPLRSNPSPRAQAVLTNATVSAAGSTIITGVAEKELTIQINVKNVPTGTAPLLVFTAQEVDEGDQTTPVGFAYVADAIGSVGVRTIRMFTARAAVKISWTLTGTTPSFTGVYVTTTVCGDSSPHGRSQYDYTPSSYASVFDAFIDEQVPLSVDAGGQLVVRGDVLTDEGSFRTDFGGNALDWAITGTLTFTKGSRTVTGVGTAFADELGQEYIRHGSDNSTFGIQISRIISQTELLLTEAYAGTSGSSGTSKAAPWRDLSPGKGGSISYNNSIATLAPGTGSGNAAVLYHFGDYLPVSLFVRCALSARNNQTTHYIGLVDDPTVAPNAWSYGAWVIFDGTANTVVKFRTQFSPATGDAEETTITLPAGLTTASQLTYNIDVVGSEITLSIEGILCARHRAHLIDPYLPTNVILYAQSGGGSAASLLVDSVYWNNSNEVSISNNFGGSPIAVAASEEIQFTSGRLTTTSVTADQTILSLTVPAGKLLLIAGFSVSCSSGLINGEPVKVGKGAMTEVNNPGATNGLIFRAFSLPAGQTVHSNFPLQVRKFAVGDEIVKITVTPSGGTSTIWRATLEYVLR